LVVERRRPPGELEHLQFYCDNCHALVEDIEFDCKDIVVHFKQAMEDFWADPKRSTCRNCGTRVTKPQPIKRITLEPTVTIERET
jgi:3-hydroxyanthranilate 3,4-dioxygenase